MADDELTRVAQTRLGMVLRGKYRLDAVLGVGGMAAVYAATHRNKKRFAIKMLHPHLSLQEDVRARFLREGYVANTVQHPGAVSVLDDDVAEDGSAFVVMELLEGRALDEVWIAHAMRVPLGLVLSVGVALLDVLAAAHEKNVVHRDLKPANVFLTDDGRLAVLDFGIARLRDGSAGDMTATGALMGTPAYMAPEQALAKSDEVDAQTDLWAVGATLFTLLTGELVHAGENAQQLLVAAATTKARAARSVALDLPAPIADVLDKALAFDKGERWKSAREMRDALASACLAATGAPIAPLPTRERDAAPVSARVTGFEATVMPSPEVSRDTASAATAATPTAATPGPRTIERAPTEATTAPDSVAAPRSMRWRAVGALLVVALALGAWRIRSWRSAPAETPSPTVNASPAPRAGKAPATPAAAAAYDAANAAWRNGQRSEAARNLEAAVAADPGLGAAYLRLACHWSGAGDDDARARAFYQKALQHRDTLGEADLALLSAIEPRLAEPADRIESGRRLLDVAKRFPGDAYVQVLLAERTFSYREEEAVAATERALAADPSVVPAYEVRVALAKKAGDLSLAKVLLERCLAASSSAVACLRTRMDVASEEGRCADVVADGRRVLAIDPASVDNAHELGAAMEAAGEPMDVVTQVLSRTDVYLTDPDARRLSELDVARIVAVRAGDFTAALAAMASALAVGAKRPQLMPAHDEDWLRENVVSIALEAGDVARARAELKAFRVSLAARSPDYEETAFVMPHLLRREVELGIVPPERVAEERRKLVARIQESEKGGRADAFLRWRGLYAHGVENEHDAKEALDALPPMDKGANWLRRPFFAWDLGRVYVLGGRPADAVSVLEKASKTCYRLNRAVDFTRSFYFLGIAREKTGDVAGAREAYREIVERWGKAKPRSVTAEKARAQLGALSK